MFYGEKVFNFIILMVRIYCQSGSAAKRLFYKFLIFIVFSLVAVFPSLFHPSL